MTKEKLLSLVKYAEGIKNKLSSPLPEKHKGYPTQYKQFLNRELASVNSKIESMKLAGVDAPAKK